MSKVYDLFVLFRLRVVQTTEELKDVHTHFLLYYSYEVPEMQKAWRAKEREAAREERKNSRKRQVNAEGEEGDGDQPEGYDAQDEENETEEVEDEPPENEIVKQAVRSGPYSMCRKAGLGESIPRNKLYN
jgi:transcription elongation factor SPT6